MNQSRTPHCLPCPFCGGEAAIGTTTISRQKDEEGNYGSFTGYSVNCIWCGANNRSIAEGYKTPELAVEKWNTRQTRSESGQGIHEGRGSSPAGALADGSPFSGTSEAKAGGAASAGVNPLFWQPRADKCQDGCDAHGRGFPPCRGQCSLLRQAESATAPIDASHLLDLLRDIYDHLSAVEIRTNDDAGSA